MRGKQGVNTLIGITRDANSDKKDSRIAQVSATALAAKSRENVLLGAFLEQYRFAVSGPLEKTEGDALKKEIREFAEVVVGQNPEEKLEDVERLLIEVVSRHEVRSKIDKIQRKAFDKKFSECVQFHLRGLEPMETNESIEDGVERVRVAADRENLPPWYVEQKISELRKKLTKELRDLPRQWDILKQHLEKKDADLYSVIQEIATVQETERFLDAAIQIPGILKESVISDAAREATEAILAESARVRLKELMDAADRESKIVELMRAHLSRPLPETVTVLGRLVDELSEKFAMLIPEESKKQIGDKLWFISRSSAAESMERNARESQFERIVADHAKNGPPGSIAEIDQRISDIARSLVRANLTNPRIEKHNDKHDSEETPPFYYALSKLRGEMTKEFKGAQSRPRDAKPRP